MLLLGGDVVRVNVYKRTLTRSGLWSAMLHDAQGHIASRQLLWGTADPEPGHTRQVGSGEGRGGLGDRRTQRMPLPSFVG